MFSARITRASPRPRLPVARSEAPALAPRSVVQALPIRRRELLPAANLYTETRGRFLPAPSGRAAVHAIAGFCEPPAQCRPPLRPADDPLGGVCELDYVADPPSAWCSWSTNRRRRRRRRPREQLNLCRKHRECVLTTLGTISRHEGGRGKSVPGHRPSRPDT